MLLLFVCVDEQVVELRSDGCRYGSRAYPRIWWPRYVESHYMTSLAVSYQVWNVTCISN